MQNFVESKTWEIIVSIGEFTQITIALFLAEYFMPRIGSAYDTVEKFSKAGDNPKALEAENYLYI